MGRRWSAHWNLLWLCLAAPCAALASDWRDFRIPPRSTAEWVLQDARVNGIKTRVQRFESELSTDEVLGFFRHEWTRDFAKAPRNTTAAGWRALSVQRVPMQFSMQVRPRAGGGSEGMLSQMNLQEIQRDFVPPELPRLPQFRVTQVTESHDGARRSRLVTLKSEAGFEITVQRLRSHWSRQGWSALHDQLVPQPGVRQWLAAFASGDRSVDVIVGHPQGRPESLVTINLLDTVP